MWYVVDGVLSFAAGAFVAYRYAKAAALKAAQLLQSGKNLEQGLKQAGVDIKKGL